MTNGDHLAAHAYATKIALMHRRIWSRWMSEAEAISAAYFGCVRAMMDRPGIDVPATFLWARGALIKERYWLQFQSQKRSHREFCDAYETEIRYDDINFQAIEDRDYADAAMRIVEELAPLQREILKGHIAGRSTSDIADDLGIKATTASALLAKAHREMSCRARGQHVAMARVGGRRVARVVVVGNAL